MATEQADKLPPDFDKMLFLIEEMIINKI